MRAIFAKTLVELAEHDPRIVLLTADLGFMVWEPFIQKFPDRFFNVGVAEQNMVGIATGLAAAGFIPFTYSIATFSVLRPYEFIRNGPVLHHLPVRIVGVGGGYEYGSAGHTHHGLEDIGVLRLQPNISIVAPADDAQAAHALRTIVDLPMPVYYRLSKNDGRSIPELNGRFRLGRVEILREGSDILWLALGPKVIEVMAAAEILAEEGISSTVALVSNFNPNPVKDIVNLITNASLTITVENHYTVGALGSLVAEIISEHQLATRFIRCGVHLPLLGVSGSQQFYDSKYNLDTHGLAACARSQLRALTSVIE